MIVSPTSVKVKRINDSHDYSMCNTTSYNSETNGRPRTVTPTKPANDDCPSNGSNGHAKNLNGESNGVTNGNGIHHLSTEEAGDPSAKGGRSFLVRLLRFLLWNGPLMVSFAMLLLSVLVKEIWDGPLKQLQQSYVLKYQDDSDLGLYHARDHDVTYYHRRCDHRDISTRDATDLLIDPNMTLKERQEVVLTHGAVVMQNMLSSDTANELRDYLENKHIKFHTEGLQLPWDELFWDGDGGQRLSLGLGPEDASIVKRAIAEVGANPQLQKTLEATVGRDPAVVEVSTLSTMFDAQPQGIHTDSDYFGSSVLYTRTFLHSYTMFIALQDTTSRMGATTICPGTHWCADEDLYNLCQCNFMDDDEDEEYPIGYCNSFEASSNGKTGLDVGVLQKGDAMMFNQNIWHRGPRNYDLKNKMTRSMFIMTFVSRRDFEKGDNRQQGWGTYYYMRHSMWGHLFSDLKTAASGGMDLFKHRLWKAYGLIGASKTGNLPWLEHWARQQANNMDFFADGELEEFQEMLRELTTKNRLADWLFLEDAVLQSLFPDVDLEEVGWNEYLGLLISSAVHQSKHLYFTVAVATVLANGVAYALYCILWGILRWTQKGKKSSSSAAVDPPKPIRDVSRTIGSIAVAHLLVLGIAAAVRHYVLYKAPLFARIHSGDVHREAFAPLPVSQIEVDGRILDEEAHPFELVQKERMNERLDFVTRYPVHPDVDYFLTEYEQLEKNRRINEYLPRNHLPEVPRLPRSTAFPERGDVLIGSRFDADFLTSMNFVLDFHPGTKEWIGLMREHLLAVSEVQDEAYLSIVVDTIVSKILGSSSLPLLSTEGGTPRRFLRQDHETGWWITMQKDEAMAITRRALLSMAHPNTVGTSYEHWKQILADARFGKRRHTALAKKWIPQIVDRMTTELFSEESALIRDDIDIVSPIPPKKYEPLNFVGHRKILVPSTGRCLLPKSMVTGKTALSPSNAALLPRKTLPLGVLQRKMREDIVTLKVGDQVLFKGDDDSDLLYLATIVNTNLEDFDAEDEMLEIRPLSLDIEDGGEGITRIVTLDHIQYYRPMREDDRVWALTQSHEEDDDDSYESWKTYEVYSISPFGQVTMVKAETPDSRYIEWDIHKMMMTEHPDNKLPKIRLRQ